MSIIEIHRYRNSATEMLPRHSHDAISEYARALNEARMASLKFAALRKGVSAPQPSAACHMLAVLRRACARWKAKHQDARRRRELEAVLHTLDAHTLADIGFNVRPYPLGHWHRTVRAVPIIDHPPF